MPGRFLNKIRKRKKGSALSLGLGAGAGLLREAIQMDGVRVKIMEVAKERFRHYGYGKTTIADIAADCKMSAGNIYRYFDSKLDIATSIVHEANEEFLARTIKKMERKEQARDRLRVFLFEYLRQTYQFIQDSPKMEDMLVVLRKERPEIRRHARRMERRVLAEILRYGKKTGEFRVDCSASMARIIQCLFTRFRWSKLTAPHIELKRLETELAATFELIYTALSAGCILGKIMRRHPKIEGVGQKVGLEADQEMNREIEQEIELAPNFLSGALLDMASEVEDMEDDISGDISGKVSAHFSNGGNGGVSNGDISGGAISGGMRDGKLIHRSSDQPVMIPLPSGAVF